MLKSIWKPKTQHTTMHLNYYKEHQFWSIHEVYTSHYFVKRQHIPYMYITIFAVSTKHYPEHGRATYHTMRDPCNELGNHCACCVDGLLGLPSLYVVRTTLKKVFLRALLMAFCTSVSWKSREISFHGFLNSSEPKCRPVYVPRNSGWASPYNGCMLWTFS